MKRAFLFFFALFFTVTTYAAVYTLHPPQKKLLTDGKLHIFLCGTGDPEPAMQALRHPACVAIVGDKQFFLVDAGEGAIQTIGSLGLPIPLLYNVFMTHWHSDHFGGLGQVINETWIARRAKPIVIHGPSGVYAAVSGLKKAYTLDAKFRMANRPGVYSPSLWYGTPKRINASKAGKQVYKNGDITVTAFLVDHDPVKPALGYRIQYKGCKLVISGDTKVVDSLAENAKNADVLINEAFSHYFYEQQKKKASKSKDPRLSSVAYLNETRHYHSDTWQLAKMAQKYKVKRLFLTHLAPAIGTSPSVKRLFTKGMRQFYKGPITVTDDRDQIVLDSNKGKCSVTYLPAKQFKMKVYKISKK